MIRRAALLSTLLLFVTHTAHAAPRQLLGKTVSLGWADSTMERRVGEEAIYGNMINRTRVIYISTAGRLFVKATNNSAKGSTNSQERDPSRSAGNFSFQGNQMVGTEVNSGFARRITVTFDPTFTSCSASAQNGHSGGSRIGVGVDGVSKFEMFSMTPGPVACSVREGNAAAG